MRRFPKKRMTPEEEAQIGKSERHRAKASMLVAGATKVLNDYDSIEACADTRVELALETLESARYELGCSRSIYDAATKTVNVERSKTRCKDPKPTEAKK